jgi:hypothetical protein
MSTPDQLVRVYIKIRDVRSKLKAEYDAQDKELEDQMNLLQAELLTFCKDGNLDSIKTSYGTASRTIKERFWTTDWDEFRKFVKENDALDLFEKRIHQTGMKQFLEENPEKLPVGLNISREYAISVRKPK